MFSFMVAYLPCVSDGDIRKAVNQEQIQDTNLYVTCMCTHIYTYIQILIYTCMHMPLSGN